MGARKTAARPGTISPECARLFMVSSGYALQTAARQMAANFRQRNFHTDDLAASQFSARCFVAEEKLFLWFWGWICLSPLMRRFA